MPMKTKPQWWAAPGKPPDNHNYVLESDGTQRCHLCGEVEQGPGPWSLTYRAARHLVHGVTAHLNVTAEGWIG